MATLQAAKLWPVETDYRPNSGELFAQTHRGRSVASERRREARAKIERAQRIARFGQFAAVDGHK